MSRGSIISSENLDLFQSKPTRRLNSLLLNFWPMVILIPLAAFAMIWGLDRGNLLDWDEAIYAQVSKEMVQTGDWLTLHYGNIPWFHKPPLYIWITAFFFQSFEVSEFWARAASALAGTVLILLTYFIGERIYNRSTGFIAAIVLLTSYDYARYSRSAMMDIMLTLFIFLGVYAYLRLQGGNRKWWYVIWVSFALSFMVKSFASLLVPAAIALVIGFDNRIRDAIQSKQLWLGSILALVIVIPWHVLAYSKFGIEFIDEYFLYHIVERSLTTLESNSGNAFFYLDKMQSGFFPWFYLAPAALGLSLIEIFKGQSRSRLLLLLSLLTLFTFTLAKTKLPWYIIPAYPALALLVAATILQAAREHNRWLLLSLVAGGLAAVFSRVDLVIASRLVPITGAAGILVLLHAALTKKLNSSILLAVLSLFLMVMGAKNIWPLYIRGEDPAAKMARIAASTGPQDREPLIVYSGLFVPMPLYYSNRPIEEAQTPEDIAGFVQGPQIKRILLNREDLPALSSDYDLKPLAEDGSWVYATIQPR